jgi:hypothetical protein
MMMSALNKIFGVTCLAVALAGTGIDLTETFSGAQQYQNQYTSLTQKDAAKLKSDNLWGKEFAEFYLDLAILGIGLKQLAKRDPA